MMKVNGKELEVELHGEGNAIIMIHGLGGTSNSWYPQISLLSRSFTVIAPDLEGSGRSVVKGRISIATLSKDIITLMNKCKIQSAHLVGHSMGTIICQHVAANNPARVRSLVLLGPLAEPPQPARSAIRERAKVAREKGMEPIADALVQAALSSDSRVHNLPVAAFVREIIMRQSPEGYARTCEALASAKSANLSKIKCPTLLITGDEDGVAPPKAVQQLQKSIKKSQMQVLPGCGHWTPIEKPVHVNEALMNFYYN